MAAAATPALTARVVSSVSFPDRQEASSAVSARGSSNSEIKTTLLADGTAESDEEVTTAEFSLDLTDGQTWAINFYECAAEGDLECLEEIIESGHVGVNDVDVDGFTALMVAAAEGHRDVVRALLRRGADVSIQTHELRSTALHFAAKNGDAAIVAALCERDVAVVDSWNINADTPLIWACIEGRAEAVQVLLTHGADVDVLNQYGASTLLCAVMVGEDPEQDTESDAQRAEIVSMLLEKNQKLVNFQDREGSTAMHLAASCGYVECVKTLLAFGADITVRNVMGQTPLEEAQESHVRNSRLCVEHLRGIWRQLEEEAATRMMAMLEMEEEADKSALSTSNATSSKKNKKKNKKAKRKAAKQHHQLHEFEPDVGMKATENGVDLPGAFDRETSDKRRITAQEDEESCASSEEERVSLDQALSFPLQCNSDVLDVDTTASADAWTTVGKKHRSALAAITCNSVKASSPLPQDALPESAQQKSAAISSSQTVPHQWTDQQPSSTYTSYVGRTASTSASRSVVACTSTRGPGKTTDSFLMSSSVLDPKAPAFRSHALTTESTGSRGLSAICSSSLLGTSSLRPSVSSSPAMTSSIVGSSSLLSTGVQYLSSGRFKWKQQRMSCHHNVANEARDRWLSKLRLWNENVAETLGYLACGLCGELVHDNLQCCGDTYGNDGKLTALACTQLYCASCLESSAFRMADLTTFKCVRCHQMIKKASMTRNNFAQAQAASLGLAMSNLTSSDDSNRYSLEDMQQLFENSKSRVSAVNLRVCHLVPGTDLSTLSNGQLEVLESVHQLGLTQMVEQRLANARALERLRMEEWFKMQPHVLHFTPR